MTDTNANSSKGATDARKPDPETTAAESAQAPAGEETPAPDAERQRLEAELDASRRRVDQLARAYQELTRDREDFKQRLTRERERMLDVERGNVATTLLETVDELDRSVSASGEDKSPLAQGVRMIRDGLLRKVQGMGIERLELVGKPFDPNVAEATDMEITASPDEDQKVVAELRAAYKLNERVIRPGRVKVAKYVAPAKA
ncbi:nucleotide exchange factor GrpE [Myxococcaceae bacterium GXIMD 01537]